MQIQAIWEKAETLQGCLAGLRTTHGRRRHEKTEIGDGFTLDEDAILKSKAWRNLDLKTQVLTRPKNAMIRNRQTHVQEVVGESVLTSEMLGLNTNLVRAAALGHDIGHVPFGHPGEHWMQKAMGRPDFCHEVMGVVVAQKIERRGAGLNLCWETLNAMMRHSGNLAKEGMSQEAWVLRYTDKITYVFHDVNDILDRVSYPVSAELRSRIESFGTKQRERVRTARSGLVIESSELGRVSFSQSELGMRFQELRDLMNEIYPHVTRQKVGSSMQKILDALTELNVGDPFLLLALMNDEDAIRMAESHNPDWRVFKETAVCEIVPYLQEIGPVDLCDPDLDW